VVARLDAFHLDTAGGFRFCLLRQPADRAVPCGTVVHVHAFAEEMNKSRRMVALAADAWVQEGWQVMHVDLGGCGDSAGDFSSASWEGWLDDVRCAYDWAMSRGDGPIWLWGLRLGALLACEASSRFRLDCGLLLWQPVTSGKQHLQQFLRLLKAAQVVGKAGSNLDESPQKRLARGETVEVAGYEISSALAQGLEAARIESLHAPRGVHWFQLVGAGAGSAAASPALERIQADCLSRGVTFQAHVAHGPSFWQTQEIEVADELLAQSRAALRCIEAERA